MRLEKHTSCKIPTLLPGQFFFLQFVPTPWRSRGRCARWMVWWFVDCLDRQLGPSIHISRFDIHVQRASSSSWNEKISYINYFNSLGHCHWISHCLLLFRRFLLGRVFSGQPPMVVTKQISHGKDLFLQLFGIPDQVHVPSRLIKDNLYR